MATQIAALNLAHFKHGTLQEQQAFAAQLGRAFTQTGFVTISGHSLSATTIASLYTACRQLFALPAGVKAKYQLPGLAGQRGYTPPNTEKAKGAAVADLKEFWQVGQFVEDGDPIKSTYPLNTEVAEVPGFYQLTRQVYKTLEADGQLLLQAIALYLGLPQNYFAPYVHNGNSILRAIHYFPLGNQSGMPVNAVRAGAHEDINLITLLIGASADGLEVLTTEGEWLPIKAGHAELVVNVGDMLQRLTNGVLKSTTHRVVNPSGALANESRYSIPFFLHPRVTMPLNCLQQCVSVHNPKHYADVTAGEYLDERLREIGLK